MQIGQHVSRAEFDLLPLGSITRGATSGRAMVAGISLATGERGAYLSDLEGLRHPAVRDFPAEVIWLPELV